MPDLSVEPYGDNQWAVYENETDWEMLKRNLVRGEILSFIYNVGWLGVWHVKQFISWPRAKRRS
jgi:hypothetical protein